MVSATKNGVFMSTMQDDGDPLPMAAKMEIAAAPDSNIEEKAAAPWQPAKKAPVPWT